MVEKFYCVGCKNHYELDVLESVKKPSKGESFRYSIVGQCPKGHKTTRICKQEVYDSYNAETEFVPSEEYIKKWGKPTMKGFVCACGEECSCDCGCAEHGICNCGLGACGCDCGCRGVSLEAESPLEDGPSPAGPPADPQPPGPSDDPHPREDFPATNEFEATEVVGTMSPGVNLEAIRPIEGGLEDGYGPSLVPADDFMPQGDGHVIGSQSTSHNYTPMHAETFASTDWDEQLFYEGFIEGLFAGDLDDEDYERVYTAWFSQVGMPVGAMEEEAGVADRGARWWMGLTDDEKNTVLDGPAGGVVDEIYEDLVNSYDYDSTDYDDDDDDEEYASESFFSNNKAKIATAAAALVIGVVYWNSRKTQ